MARWPEPWGHGRRRLRRSRRWRRLDARLLTAGDHAARSGLRAVDRRVAARRQTALVVEDDEDVLDLVEVGGRREIGGLDDAVGVAPDVDDLADQEALRIGRTDAATELDARGQDFLAELDRLRRVD